MEFNNDVMLLIVSIIVSFNTVVLVPILKWALALEKRVLFLEALETAENKIKG